MVSGNGQIVFNDLFTNTVPMVVQANDSRGNPVKGVSISWSIKGTGTLVDVQTATDPNGQASTAFVNSSLTPYESFLLSTVTASSSYGSVTFQVTSVPSSLGSNPVPQPVVNLEQPAIGSTLTAPTGSTKPGAVVVQVLAGTGTQANSPLPNVSIRIVNAADLSTPAPAHCNGVDNEVLTNSSGIATCDLVITGQAGDTVGLAVVVGEFHETAAFNLQIQAGVTCTYSLSASSQPFGSAGGSGSFEVNTGSSCGWTATSNASWISVTGGSSGTGSGKVSYSVAANTGQPRVGTISVSGQTFTVNQGSGAPGSLAITSSPNLPGGTVNVAYSTTLSASGGQSPYTWAISSGALPPGLTLDSSTGIISGTPTAASSSPYTFQITVTDAVGSTLPQNCSLTINSASTSGFKITNTSFPNGVVEHAYPSQTLAATGGVVTPFNPNPSFQVSGGALPDGLSLRKGTSGAYAISGTPTTPGQYNFTVMAVDAAGHSASANFTITITGTPTSQQMTANPASVSFTIQLGSTNIPADQQVALTSNAGALSYTSVISTNNGGSWLVAKTSTSGNTPGSITLGVANYSSLGAGQYTGTLIISSVAANSPVVVQATLTVVAAPAITAAPGTISVTQGITSGSNVTHQTIQLSNGTADITFTASASADKGGKWLTVTPVNGNTPATLTAAIDSGGLALGTYTGSITVTPASGTALKIPVTLNVVNPATLSASPAPLTFTSTQGGPTPDFQAVTVTSSGAPLTVSATIATQTGGGWLSVSPPSGQTSLNMSVTVNPSGLAPGNYSGIITMAATDPSVAPLQVVVVLNVTPAVPTVASVTNAASFAPGPVAPGELVTIFGTAIGPSTGIAFQPVSGGMPVVLSNTEVFFDGHAASMVYTSAGQISAIVPYAIAGRSATNLVVEYNNVKSAGFALRVIDSVPGIFTIGDSGQGAIINQDGTVNSASNPAPAGSVVSIYATGEGQTNPPGKDGAINGDVLSALPAPLQTVTVQIGGQPAETPAYAGAAPFDPAGVLQVNATVPTGLKSGSVPVVITVGTASSQAGVTIAVK